MNTIIVGYDGSDSAKRALERAAQLATALTSKIVVVTVAEPIAVYPAVGGMSGYVPPAEPETARAHEMEEERVERLLGEARARLQDRDIASETISVSGPPVEAIVEAAEEHDADLLVVGTHEPGFFERLYRGSVGQGVARRAHCDVLVVHPEQAREDD